MYRLIEQFRTPQLNHYWGVFYSNIEGAIGYIHQDRIEHLCSLPLFNRLFIANDQQRTLHFSPLFCESPFEKRNKWMESLGSLLYHHYPHLAWRDEPYGYYHLGHFSEPLFTFERALAPFFGFPAYGTHITGFLWDKHLQSPSKIWIAKRSASKKVEPSKLDQLVGGGLSYGMTPLKNVIKEAYEEAKIPAHLLKELSSPPKIIRYMIEERGEIRQDLLFNYQLLLPNDFNPTPLDGEVEHFMLLPPSEVINQLETPERFKPNSGLVMIQFLLHHQLIPKDYPNFQAIKEGIESHSTPSSPISQ